MGIMVSGSCPQSHTQVQAPHCPVSQCARGVGGSSVQIPVEIKEVRACTLVPPRQAEDRAGTRQCGTVLRNRYLPFAPELEHPTQPNLKPHVFVTSATFTRRETPLMTESLSRSAL